MLKIGLIARHLDASQPFEDWLKLNHIGYRWLLGKRINPTKNYNVVGRISQRGLTFGYTDQQQQTLTLSFVELTWPDYRDTWTVCQVFSQFDWMMVGVPDPFASIQAWFDRPPRDNPTRETKAKQCELHLAIYRKSNLRLEAVIDILSRCFWSHLGWTMSSKVVRRKTSPPSKRFQTTTRPKRR